jgi:hypothetical protein
LGKTKCKFCIFFEKTLALRPIALKVKEVYYGEKAFISFTEFLSKRKAFEVSLLG